MDYDRTEEQFSISNARYAVQVDQYIPEKIIGLAVLGPSWLSRGIRVNAWAKRLSEDLGVASFVPHFPGHGVTEGREGVAIP